MLLVLTNVDDVDPFEDDPYPGQSQTRQRSCQPSSIPDQGMSQTGATFHGHSNDSNGDLNISCGAIPLCLHHVSGPEDSDDNNDQGVFIFVGCCSSS